MALEIGTFISDLVVTNPTSSDPKNQGDDHLRLVKSTVKATFPNVTGAVTLSHTELNYVAGVTSAIQTQLNTEVTNRTNADALKANLASPTFTGVVTIPSGASIAGFAPLDSPALTGAPTAPTATVGTATTQVATTAFVVSTSFSTALPSQAGNAGKMITTNGTTAAWTADLSGLTADGTNVVGFRHIPQISQSVAYTLVLTDAGKHILHPSADTTARIFAIPANASVAFPIGTAITFVNQASAGVVTIAITTDVMRLAGAGTTGSRTLAANGVATAVKLTATEWLVSGTGLT